MRTLGRFANHVENRSRAYGGSSRTADTPAVASTTLRTTEPGRAPTTDAAGIDRLFTDAVAQIKAQDDPLDLARALDDTAQAIRNAAQSRATDPMALIEVMALVGYYHTISFLCRSLDLPLEPYSARFPVSA